MSCGVVRGRLSAFMDGDLAGAEARAVAVHLDACPECREVENDLRRLSDVLGDLPRLDPPPSLASGVRVRIEVESRGPGLALLFRPSWRARPLMLPSLIPAALVLMTVLAGALALDRGPGLPTNPDTGAAWARRFPASGTEGNPLFPAAGVSAPRARAGTRLPVQVYADMEEGTLFLETVVARDGSVSAVNLLEGDSAHAKILLEALQRERFWPGRYNGRPVAVSVYRLISRMDVRAPVT
jgi:hypothetical protein